MQSQEIFNDDIRYYKEIYLDVIDPSMQGTQEFLPIEINGDIYLWLKISGLNLNDVEEPIAIKDYFMLDDVAVDCKNGLFRIYPKLPNTYVIWDVMSHTIKSVAGIQNEYRLA